MLDIYLNVKYQTINRLVFLRRNRVLYEWRMSTIKDDALSSKLTIYPRAASVSP